MKLIELHPEWVRWAHDRHIPDGAPATWRAIEISFDCPIHKNHRVHVPFANPFDGVTPVNRNNLWTRTGDTFDTLTLAPSIDYTKYDNGLLRDATCWHGWVQNGDVT